ncbi:MAG: NAD(P)H-hydrate dehydratase [Thermodesulfobacteriota bacterium]
MKVVDAETMQRIDAMAIKEYGLPRIALMENAGKGVAEIILRNFTDLKGKKVSIFCGKGNNGGDGMVVARHLTNSGTRVSVYLLANEDNITGDAKANLDVWKKMGGDIDTILSVSDIKRYESSIRHSMVLVDAIFGTGLSSEVEGIHSETIDFINRLDIPIVSVDTPSGLDCNTGRILGRCIVANITVTLGSPKVGLLLHEGIDHTGVLEMVDIGIPSDITEEIFSPYTLLDDEEIEDSLLPRRSDFHKGDAGHLLVLAGSLGKTGAAALVCKAALRVGAGLVTLGIPRSLNPVIEEKLTETMTYPLMETDDQTLSSDNIEIIKGLLKGKKALALGPGLTTHPEVKELLLNLIRDVVTVPMVIDADGINCLAGDIEVLQRSNAPIILTPHPGEMARLEDTTTSLIQEERLRVVREFAEEHSVVMVLKGARTLVSDTDGNLYINPTGNAGMATAGTGDVLTGVIGGLLAQGYMPLESAKIGVYIHGMAGDRITEDRGMLGVIASDIADELPMVLKEFYC